METIDEWVHIRRSTGEHHVLFADKGDKLTEEEIARKTIILTTPGVLVDALRQFDTKPSQPDPDPDEDDEDDEGDEEAQEAQALRAPQPGHRLEGAR